MADREFAARLGNRRSHVNANELKALCSGWPGVSSRIKWEDDLVFAVAGKMFAVSCLRGPDRERLSFKVDAEHFVDICARSGIVPAHFAARGFWVTIVEPERFTAGDLGDYVRHSYELVRAGLNQKQLLALDSPASVREGARDNTGTA